MDSTMANAEHSDSSGEENTWTRDQEVLLIAQELADPPTELCARAIMTQRNTRYVSVSESHQHTAEVCGVMSQVPKCDATPFVCSTSIAWDHISCGLWSAQDCRNKWISMAAEVRYYRTTLEVAVDLLSQCDTKPSAKEIKEVKKWNSEFMTPNETVSKAPSSHNVIKVKKKTKTPQNPDYPKKPSSSAYVVFCTEKLPEVGKSHSGKDLMLQVANEWKNTDQSQRKLYIDLWHKQKEDYETELKKYEENHPDDDVIKHMVANLKTKSKSSRKSSSKSSSKSSATVVCSPPTSPIIATPASSASTGSPHKHKKSNKTIETSDSEIPSSVSHRTPQKHKLQSEDSDEESTPRKHKSPKKAKKIKIEWTGASLFIELKIEAYQLDHPDMAIEDVHHRLNKKFSKLADHKKEKYERMATEKNAG